MVDVISASRPTWESRHAAATARCVQRVVTGGARAAFVGLAITASFGGCKTPRMYSGPRLPASEVAIVEKVYRPSTTVSLMANAPDTSLDHQAGIAFWTVSLDGKNTPKRDFEVLPGRHVATVVCVMARSEARATVEFDAEAGHTYRPNGRIVELPVQPGEEVVRGIVLTSGPYYRKRFGATLFVEDVSGEAR